MKEVICIARESHFWSFSGRESCNFQKMISVAWVVCMTCIQTCKEICVYLLLTVLTKNLFERCKIREYLERVRKGWGGVEGVFVCDGCLAVMWVLEGDRLAVAGEKEQLRTSSVLCHRNVRDQRAGGGPRVADRPGHLVRRSKGG